MRSDQLTLYQCFLTLPSVLFGNVLAISAQLLPASRICFRRCSSAGVHGVFVRPFFAGGAAGDDIGSAVAGVLDDGPGLVDDEVGLSPY
jgi:hypothetical protein